MKLWESQWLRASWSTTPTGMPTHFILSSHLLLSKGRGVTLLGTLTTPYNASPGNSTPHQLGSPGASKMVSGRVCKRSCHRVVRRLCGSHSRCWVPGTGAIGAGAYSPTNDGALLGKVSLSLSPSKVANIKGLLSSRDTRPLVEFPLGLSCLVLLASFHQWKPPAKPSQNNPKGQGFNLCYHSGLKLTDVPFRRSLQPEFPTERTVGFCLLGGYSSCQAGGRLCVNIKSYEFAFLRIGESCGWES